MKTTKRGRPFLKVSCLPRHFVINADHNPGLLGHPRPLRHPHRLIRTNDPQTVLQDVPKQLHHVRAHYIPIRTTPAHPPSPHSEEASVNLSSLKFSQSNRGPDPRDPTRIVTTTTTTTFSMTREMAKAMCQHFMDARLIENAADRNSNLFKERGIYMLTPKGLHVLERFISKNGMTADHLLKVFSSQPICLKLLHLERRQSDDEIIISQSVVTALFRRFSGRIPNYMPETVMKDPALEYPERSKGIPVVDVTDRPPQMVGKADLQTYYHCFAAVAALEWLCDFTSIVGRDEAAEMAAHFVRFGYIALVSDKRKGGDSAVIFTVRGTAASPGVAAVRSPLPPPLCVSLTICTARRVPVHCESDLPNHR